MPEMSLNPVPAKPHLYGSLKVHADTGRERLANDDLVVERGLGPRATLGFLCVSIETARIGGIAGKSEKETLDAAQGHLLLARVGSLRLRR